MLKKVTLVLLVFTVLLSGFAYWAVGNSFPRLSKLNTRSIGEKLHLKPKSTYTVLTYNIGHGQGIKNEPTDWRDKAYTLKKLKALSKVIKKSKADFVLLQEVDLDSDRSYNINQAEFLAKNAKYPYYACSVLWDENYLPFPFWPPEKHLGKVQAANCTFSKYPLSDHERLVFDKPESNAFWYNWGYIDRAAQKVIATVGKQQVAIVNTHFEAWDVEARHKQAKRMAEWIRDFKLPTLIGGDFNAVPPDALKRTNFVDSPQDDYTGDNTVSILLKNLPKVSNWLDHESSRNNMAQYTFPADIPTRTLDYIFGYDGIELLKSTVVKEAGVASDHLPVWANFKIN